MTDIDTIREALEEADSHCYTDTDSARVRSLAKTALAALERVSALNSEMEAVLRRILCDREVTLAPREVSDAFAVLLKTKESR